MVFISFSDPPNGLLQPCYDIPARDQVKAVLSARESEDDASELPVAEGAGTGARLGERVAKLTEDFWMDRRNQTEGALQ